MNDNLFLAYDIAVEINWEKNSDGSYKIHDLLKLVDEENIITIYTRLEQFTEISCEANYKYINKKGLEQIKRGLNNMNIKQIRQMNAKKNDVSAVYKITNTYNNKVYVGSSIHVYSRFKEHIRDLNNNEHHCKSLQDDYNLLHKDVFEFDILECESDREKLFKLEQEYINKYKNCYNTYSAVSMIEFDGKKYELREFCNKYELDYTTVHDRYYNNCSVEDLFKSKEQYMIDNDKLITITIDDKNYTLKQAEKKFGIASSTIKQRYYQGKTEYDLVKPIENKLDSSDLSKIVGLIRSGQSLKSIATLYKCTNSNLSVFLKRHGINFYENFHKYRNDMIRHLKEKFNLMNKEIATAFNMPCSQISTICKN